MPYKDPEDARRYAKAYYQRHKEEISKYDKAHYAAHRAERSAGRRQLLLQIKFEVLGHYSIVGHPTCLHCEIDDIDVLTIDHINNDGTKQRKVAGVGANLYRWLRKNNYPTGYQTLCANCNLKKEILRRRNQ